MVKENRKLVQTAVYFDILFQGINITEERGKV